MAYSTDSQQAPEPSEAFHHGDRDGGDEALTDLTAEGLVEKPELLQEELDRTKRELQDLVTKNCDLLLAASKSFGSAERDVKSAFSTVISLKAATGDLQHFLQAFLASEAERSEKEASLQKIAAAQDNVAEALALPWTIRSYYEAGLYAEAVDTTVAATEQLLLLLARAPSVNENLRRLQRQVERERMRCSEVLLRTLESPATHFAEVVRFVGYLRRLDILRENQLRTEILKRRSIAVDREKQAVEKQCSSCPTRALCVAANLLATGVLEVVVQYRALFKALDDVSAAWLSEQITWFLSLLFSVLKAGVLAQEARSTGTTAEVDEAAPAAEQVPAAVQAAVTAGGGGPLKEASTRRQGRVCFRLLEQQSVCAVYRETHHAAANLSRVGGYFFAAAAPAFETYLRKIVEDLTSLALRRFVEEMEKAYTSWSPGSLFCGPSAGVEKAIALTASTSSTACGHADSAAFQKRLTLLWYPPLCVFYNGLVEAINAVLDFPLLDVIPSLYASVLRALWRGAHTLRNVLKMRASYEEWTTERKTEFTRLCNAFSSELLDLVGLHLRPLQAKPCDTEVSHPLLFAESSLTVLCRYCIMWMKTTSPR